MIKVENKLQQSLYRRCDSRFIYSLLIKNEITNNFKKGCQQIYLKLILTTRIFSVSGASNKIFLQINLG
jgi:hypothetical protein